MRRARVLLLSVILLLGTALMGGASFAAAQDATPPADEGEGVSFEFIGYGEAERLPPSPVGIALLRIGFEPGGFFPIDPEDPSLALVYVESGIVTFNVEVPITVLHVPENAEPGPEDLEMFPAGEDFTMEEGDSALFPPNIAGEVRNDGDQDASLLLANIEPLGEEGAATPVT